MHHDTEIHAIIDEQPLGEAATEIVRGNEAKVLIAGLIRRVVGSPLDDSTDTELGEINKRRIRRDAFGNRIAVDVPLNARRKVRITGLPT